MVIFFVLVELSFLFYSCILVLLILGDKIVHVTFSLSELHLIHTLASVPVKEGLPAEHDRELLGYALPSFLNSGGVTNEGGGHFKTLGWYVTDGGLDVVGDPFDEVRRVLVHYVEHLLIYLLLKDGNIY